MIYRTITTGLGRIARNIADRRLPQRFYRTGRRFPRRTVLAAFFTLLLILPMFLYMGRAHADSQGPLSAGSTGDCVDDASAGTVVWTNPGNAFSANGTFATASVDGTTTQYIKCTNYGFTIPAGSTINGIVVGVERKASGTTNGGVTDAAMRLVKGGTIGTTDRATGTSYTTTNTYQDHGTTSDLWGDTWAVSDINASNFGAAFAATKASAAGAALTASVDHIRITVTYTPPQAQLNQSAYRWFNNQDATASLSFTNSSNSAGTNPTGVATGNFDGVNGLDLVTANSGANSISICMNFGGGSMGFMQPKVDYTTGTTPTAVATGDFDGDGDIDIAVTNGGDNTVSIFKNNGDGTFAAKVDYPTGTSPTAIDATNLDGDGDIDLVVTNGTDNTVSVLMNNGNGTFAGKVDYPTGTLPQSVTATDFNGDGKADLAVVNKTSESVSILMNNGNGTFAGKVDYPTGTSTSPTDVVAADFNSDGAADIAVSLSAANLIAVYRNNGDGTFATGGQVAHYITGTTPAAITAGDFTGSGKIDLAVTNTVTQKVSIFLNNGDGTFASKVDVSAGVTSPRNIIAADLTGDGISDLIETGGVGAVNTTEDLLNTTTLSNPTVGTALAAQDTVATAPSEGTIFRLRMDMHVTNAQLSASAGGFKLQFALKGAGTCAAPTGSYADVSDTSTGVRYADNALAKSGLSLTTNANDPIHGTDTNVTQSYQETGTTTFTNPSAVPIGQDGMWDFGLKSYHALQNTTYCFKAVNNLGADLNTYTVYPELTMPAATFKGASYRWYNPAPVGSASTFAKQNAASGYGSGASDVVLTSDGGYATAGFGGYTDFYTSEDARITKFDSTGSSTWYHDWGSAAKSLDSANSIIQTSDGGYAITGSTNSFGTATDMFLAKYDSSGALSWSKIWGGSGSDTGGGLVQTSDGGYVVTGTTLSYGSGNHDMFLAKFTSTGTLSWSKTWGGTGEDFGYDLVLTSDGGFAVTGSTASYGAGGGDMFLARYDSSGGLTWSKTWGGTGADVGYDLVQTSDGGFAVTGSTASYGAGGGDMFLARYDSSGGLTWSKTWGGTGADQGNSVVQTTDSGFAVTGSTASYGAGGSDMFLAKYDSSGTLSWSKTFGTSGEDGGNTVKQTTDGGFAVAGSSTSGGATTAILVRYDSSGSLPGCNTTMCQSPTPSTSSITPSTASPTASTTSPSASSSGVTAGNEGSTTPADTVLVATATPVGSPYAAQNYPLDLVTITPISLRLDIAVDGSGLAMNGQAFKLQFAARIGVSTCSAVPTGNFADVTSVSTLRYYDDSRYSDGQAIGSGTTDPSDGTRTLAAQAYQESNSFTNSASDIYAGQDGMWQFSLAIDNSTIMGRDFCIRAVLSSGTVLTMTSMPEVAYSAQMDELLAHGEWFNRQGIRQSKIL